MTDQQPPDKQALEQRIQDAFARRENQTGLQLLRELARVCPEDAEVQHRLGAVEEQLGSPQAALQAHLRSVQLAARNPLAYAYAGYCLQQLGRLEDAVAVWSLGSDLDPSLLQGSQRRDPTGLRLNAAAIALRQHFSRLHREASGAGEAVARVRNAHWVQTSDVPFSFRTPAQRPHLFYLPDLPARPWYEPDDWTWSRALQEATAAILDEFVANQAIVDAHGRPYIGKGLQLGKEFAALQGSLNWTALDLYRDGILQAAAAQSFPLTLEALSRLPLYGINENPFEVFFSVLKPGQHIAPHYGLSNHSITVHLPLVAPEGCSVTVAGEARQTRRGKLLAFDDSYLHEARNRSESDRVVLIFSIWHPDLSAAEQGAIRQTFRHRNQWLGSRRLPSA